MNSIGSVIPVIKDVKATLKNNPLYLPLLSFGTQWYIARHAAGKPNIIVEKRPAKKRVPSVYRPT